MNATNNMMLMAQMLNAQMSQSNPALQNPAKQEDGSSFRDLMQQKQPPAKQPAQKPAQNNRKQDAPQDAPATQAPQAENAAPTQEQAPVAAVPLNIIPVEVQQTADGTVQVLPQQTAVLSQVPGQQQTATQQKAPETQLPMQTQNVQTAASAQLEPEQQVQTKAEPTMDFNANQAKPEGEALAGKNGSNVLQDTEQVTVKQSEEAPAQPLFRELEGTPIKVGEAPTADAEAPDFEQQLAKQIDTALAKGSEKIEIKLTPEHLGKLTIELTRAQDGSVRLVLNVTNEKAANLLSEHSGSLASLLRGNTQVPVQVEIQQQNQQQEQGQREHQQQQQQGNQQQQNQQNEQQAHDFLQQLRLGLVPLESEAS